MLRSLRLASGCITVLTGLGIALVGGTGEGARAAGEAPTPPANEWSFDGVFGMYDKAQLQRGFQVYKEVCAACHAMNLLHYRNLAEPGGPGFTEEQVKVIAAEVEVEDGPNDEGEMFERPGRPSDRFKSPYPNKEAARAANGGAYPPDLSLMAKARKYGPDYLVALLLGYVEPPAGFELSEGMSYNTYFPGHQIAMAKPLDDDYVEYTDGTPATLANQAKDVSAFLMWAAEPKLEERKRMGMQVMAYLFVLAGFFYIAKRKVWRDVKH